MSTTTYPSMRRFYGNAFRATLSGADLQSEQEWLRIFVGVEMQRRYQGVRYRYVWVLFGLRPWLVGAIIGTWYFPAPVNDNGGVA